MRKFFSDNYELRFNVMKQVEEFRRKATDGNYSMNNFAGEATDGNYSMSNFAREATGYSGESRDGFYIVRNSVESVVFYEISPLTTH